VLPDPRAVHISTDGSCYWNPGGKSGWAAIVHYPDHLDREDEQIVDFGCEESNNRMELLACIRVLGWIRENAPWGSVTRVQVFTDSQYVNDNLTRAREWKKNERRNQYGEPRENSDLWNQLLAAQTKTRITVHFEWTLGKKTPILKRVDKAAKAAATRGGPDIDRATNRGQMRVRWLVARLPGFRQEANLWSSGHTERTCWGGAKKRFGSMSSTKRLRPISEVTMRLPQLLSPQNFIASTDVRFGSMTDRNIHGLRRLSRK
jgi:ribonuclease HI